MAIAYLGIGSNLGNRKKHIESAITLLKKNSIDVLRCSSIIETAPVGGPSNQQYFLNGALKIETELSAQDLLDVLKSIEKKLGRENTERNGPRPIDLDILIYDQLQIQTPQLTIPHPRMIERDFVMRPLHEIEPQLTEDLTHARH